MNFSRIGTILLLAAGFAFTGCGLFRVQTPSARFQAFYRAVRSGQAAAIKDCVTRDSLSLGEQIARAQNKTLDQLIEENDGDRSGLGEEMPSIGDEVLAGETATLQVKPESGKGWIIVPFIKEGGEWKIAFDNLMSDRNLGARLNK